MPAHVLTVYQLSDASNELIAKKVRKESHELKILRLLNTIQPKSENIVLLLDSFSSCDPQFTSWVILPKMDSVANYMEFAPQKLRGKVTEICWGLIKGLAHLHGLCIAHRDVKPDNLLVDQAFCLKIIDFDIALQVKDEGEEVDDHCGTTHWIAPEIEEKLVHSPIKADRWSCGRVILCLLDDLRKEDKGLRMMGEKLTAHDPKQRPTLLEWPSWLGALTLNVVNVLKAGERKASRPLQDGMEGNEKITKFRKVKKQRLID
jgi:serine/threonine protein kinase